MSNIFAIHRSSSCWCYGIRDSKSDCRVICDGQGGFKVAPWQIFGPSADQKQFEDGKAIQLLMRKVDWAVKGLQISLKNIPYEGGMKISGSVTCSHIQTIEQWILSNVPDFKNRRNFQNAETCEEDLLLPVSENLNAWICKWLDTIEDPKL